MQNRPLGLVFTLCAAWLSLTLSATSASARGCHSRVESTTYEINLRGTHGYAIDIVSSRNGTVTLSAASGEAFAKYSVAGRSNERGLVAHFGQLGYVTLHFARPRRELFQTESVGLKGKIEFHGEQGFTTVAATRVKGFVARRFKRVCSSPSGGGRVRAALSSGATRNGFPFITTVSAVEATPNRAVGLKVRHIQPVAEGEGDSVVAKLKEHRERMTILRVAVDDHLTQDGTLIASPPSAVPVTGTLAPPFPFVGTATYSGTSGSTANWSGDLSAWMPGAGYVPLTGPGFTSLLCSGEETTEQLNSCEDEAFNLFEGSELV